jgi:3D (Asp-Asp-Asp) domain-containing protein
MKKRILSYILSSLIVAFSFGGAFHFLFLSLFDFEKKESVTYSALEDEEGRLSVALPCGEGGVLVTPSGERYEFSYYIDVTATAYTHTGSPTYTGGVAEVGVIAVDPRNIELGSSVYVIGEYGDFGLRRAEDIGGGIKGARIDVFLDSEEECIAFGRRKMRAFILK